MWAVLHSLVQEECCHSATESGTCHRWASRWLNARNRGGKRWWTYFLYLMTHMPGREVTANANPITWHSACNIACVAEAYAASPERFPPEESCFTSRHLLPFRLPQVPCSPQAQGTSLSHCGVTRLIMRDHQQVRMTLSDGDTRFFLSTKTRREAVWR